MSSRYEKREKLGQGGLGTVFKAFDNQLKREVALKRVLTPTQEAVENLRHEATALSSLMHPNIVTVFDVGQDDEGGFVVMELLDGETLDDTIARAPLTLQDFAEVVNQTLEALMAAQAVNMTHRDLKPSNVMVIWRPSGRFQIKVLDFGLAKVSSAPTPQTTDQEEGIMGSIYFMAPEQFERTAVDFRTDMYAMGCIYYYCLTGKYPFDGDTAPQVMMAHLYHQVRPLESVRPDIPKQVAQWVMWLMARNREDRPASAREALDRFPDLTRPTPVISGPIPRDGTVQASPAPPLAGAAPARAGAAAARATSADVPSAARGKTGTVSRAAAERPATQTATASSAGSVWNDARYSAAEARALAEMEAAKRKKLLFIIASSISALAIIVIGSVILAGKMQVAKEFKRIDTLDESPAGVAADVPLLLRHISENPAQNDARAVRILSELRGEGVDDALRRELASLEPGYPRLGLLQVVAKRSLSGTFPSLLNIYRTTPSPKERVLTAYALVRLAGPGDEKALLELLKSPTMDGSERSQLEDGIYSILLRNGDVAGRAQPLLKELKASSGKYRESLARILGSLGEQPVLDGLAEGLSGAPTDYILALNHWPDRSSKEPLEAFLKAGDTNLKIYASRAYLRMLQLPTSNPDDSASYRLALDSVDKNDIRKVFSVIVANPTPQSLKFCQETKIAGLESSFNLASNLIQEAMRAAIVVRSGELIPAVRAKVAGQDQETRFDQKSDQLDWRSPRIWMSWLVKLENPGTYEISVLGSCPENPGSDLKLTFVGEPLKAKTKKTKDDAPEPLSMGTVKVDAAQQGPRMVYLSAGPVAQPGILKVKGIRFTKKN